MSNRGTHKTRAEKNISEHRDKEETKRQCKFIYREQKGYIFCVPFWVFVGMRVHLARDWFCEHRICSGRWQVTQLSSGQTDAKGVFFACEAVIGAQANIIPVASPVLDLCDMYFVWG